MKGSNIKGNFSHRLVVITTIIVFLCCPGILNAQPHPPKPIKINATSQVLAFGAFYQGAGGGSVIIAPAGTRSSTGNIVLLNMGYTYSAALFELYAHPGTIISILNGPNSTLTGTPSGTMTMQVGSSSPSSPFVTNQNFNVAIKLYIGGTLTVGSSAANPPGSYTGTFYITLVQE